MKFKVYPYKQGSASAKTLATHLNGKVLKREGSKYSPKPGDCIVNWGSSSVPGFGPATVLNSDLSKAQNKLIAFEEFRNAEVSIPSYWTDRNDIPLDVYPVLCRTVLGGHSGAGIVIASNPEELVDAPLYVQYVKKKDEYRVHVVKDKVIFVQRKARKLDVPNPNWMVRNLAGGFVFVDATGQAPVPVIDQSIIALHALGLDFGGADVIWNDKTQKAYVLEVNTACGLEDRTAEKYAEAFNEVATT